MRCLRRVLRVPYTAHRTNESVREEVSASIGPHETLLATTVRRKLRWFGHVKRSAGLANRIAQGMVEGARSRGRPKMRWMDNIRGWTGLSVEEAHRASKIRRDWRVIIYAASQATPLRSLRTRNQ